MSKALTIVLVMLLGTVGVLVAFAIDFSDQGSPKEPCAFHPATMTATGCTVKSDTGSSADPEALWGSIDCASNSRASVVASGGDPHPTATGAPQGDDAYRRLTVLDGDNVSGERCELGRNEWTQGSEGGEGTFQLYREGERRITFVSFRLPENFPISTTLFQNVLQMKQTQPSDNGAGIPVLSLQVSNGEWKLNHADSPAGGTSETLWEASAGAGVWIRVALDVKYSQHDDEGRVKLYLDRNGDGDWLDAEERSPPFTTHTLKYELPDHHGAASETNGLAPGDSIPSHLRVGLYHDPSIDCPAPRGCSIEIDNVQVVGP
jgi:hypothetical protein